MARGRGYYPPELSKSDPLVAQHLKIPTSTAATIDAAAHKQQRSRAWLMREILSDWALDYRKSGAGAEYREDSAAGLKKRRLG